MYFLTDASAIRTKFASAGLSRGHDSGRDGFDETGDWVEVAGVGLGLGVTGTEGIGFGTGTSTGVGFVIATPLFQTSFLPLLIHVNFLPLAVAVMPAFLQVSPALTAATALMGAIKRDSAIKMPSNFFIYED
jgi:hypothetical protein